MFNLISYADLKKKVESVITPEGDMRLCGREACADVISGCAELFPEITVGDLKTKSVDRSALLTVYNFLKLADK